MSLLKWVFVKITVYNTIVKASKLRQYIIDCVATGEASVLYLVPNITAIFYLAGTNAAAAIQTSITNYNAAPTKANRNIMKDKMALGVVWLDSYAAFVAGIANLPANCTTREEAATNISTSFLTPQKITASTAGAPEIPAFTAVNIGTEKVEIEVSNGKTNKPKVTVFVFVPLPPVADPVIENPVVELINGKIKVTSHAPIEIITATFIGQATKTEFTDLISGQPYHVYGYTMNGNKLISKLSAPVLVKG